MACRQPQMLSMRSSTTALALDGSEASSSAGLARRATWADLRGAALGMALAELALAARLATAYLATAFFTVRLPAFLLAAFLAPIANLAFRG